MKEKYIKDLQEIKEMMNRSSRFISLSGLAGITTGIIALIGAYIAHHTVFTGQDYLSHKAVDLPSEKLTLILLIATSTILLAAAAAIYFTTRETKLRNQPTWDHQTKRLLINLAIPLVAGGILCLMLVTRGYVGMLAPITLIFYGMALVTASKYTLNELRSLGLIEIMLGLMAFQFIGQGLLFWAFGFGILHIVYGIIIQRKNKQ